MAFGGAERTEWGAGVVVMEPDVAHRGSLALLWSSGGASLAHQACHAHQVVGGRHEVARQLGARQAAVARSAEAAHFLQPTEDVLDAFPDPLTDGVARMTSGAPIDGAASSLVFCATCGVTWCSRMAATHARAS